MLNEIINKGFIKIYPEQTVAFFSIRNGKAQKKRGSSSR